MKKIFLAFPGYQVKINGKIKKVGPFEFWNLEKIDKDEFINLIQKKIKPVNKNVRKNYYTISSRETYEKSYQEATWGMLLPHYKDQFEGWYETFFVVNLYTDQMLPLLFTVGNMGVFTVRSQLPSFEKAIFHSVDRKFTNKKFTKFYNLIIPEVQNINWNAYEVLRWDREQWRLSIVCGLYDELKKYQNSKEIMTWQKECADMTTLYEALLSRPKTREYGKYKMIQRIQVLLAGTKYFKGFNNTEKDLGDLFDFRNEFVHGSFYNRLMKETKKISVNQSTAQMPSVDFRFLTEQKEILRKVLIIYIYLQKKFKNTRNANLRQKSISEIINMAIMDTVLRKRIQKYSAEILKLVYNKK